MAKAKKTALSAFTYKSGADALERKKPFVHQINAKAKIRCDTEGMGYATPLNRGPAELVLDATEGFIPLWAKNTVLRWRFRRGTLQAFEKPQAAKAEIESLLAEAILAWGDSAPVTFVQRDDAWDFEIAVKQGEECDATGCVLASAFFPDAGQHVLQLYPTMFEQPRAEQIETLVHEIGHVFGLRHFFAQVTGEKVWPSEIFGTHSKFSIMNYGKDSRLTLEDKSDLKRLYKLVWSGKLTEINGTPIRMVKPFHDSGVSMETMRTLGVLPKEPPLAAFY